ncbi:16S rRNA (guanine(527)-N(7))-methyltransferase RsmG [candidate division KSB1 bacterium]|nr:16S rRNA (guanine(527)-N(7))-methyltransferase RsmG [candidate division KSB1 bacterium]
MIKSWNEQLNTLKSQLQQVNVCLSSEQLTLMNQYLNLLVAWNERTNLVSRNDAQYLVERHLLESIAVATVSDFMMNSIVMDLGSGAGFPGIPLKILRPDLEITLIDSKRMKFLFLKEVIRQLNLNKAEVLCARVESLNASFLNRFDFIVCRAVATLSELWNWSAKYLKQDGKLLAMKGGDLIDECAEFQHNFPESNLEILGYPETLKLNKFFKKLVFVTKES